jgi:membrane protease YdiL (CAAX protease family)
VSDGAPALWLRVVAQAGAALALLLLGEPRTPGTPMPPGPAFLLAIGAGAVLLLVLARRPLRLRIARDRFRIVAAKAGVLGLLAFCEEVIWRWFAIGGLTPRVGAGVAFAASTIGFALCHAGQGTRAIRVHLLTGSTFGAVFLASGSLAAAAAAHATYNLGVLLALEGRRRARTAAASGSP